MKTILNLVVLALLAMLLYVTAPRGAQGGVGFLDHLLTISMVAVVWIAMRRRIFARLTGERPATEENAETTPRVEVEEENQEMVSHDAAAWSVVARGDTLGTFRNAPIPSWILTSDGRRAVYAGISQVVLPDEFACVELPGRGEIIIPPGLIYAFNS